MQQKTCTKTWNTKTKTTKTKQLKQVEPPINTWNKTTEMAEVN